MPDLIHKPTFNRTDEAHPMENEHSKAAEPKPDPSRRSFLKAAPLGALAAVAGGAEAKPELAPVEAAKPDVKRGYHETEHIRTYYKTAAYW
ncbi:twin-arginine translocation signal domain-containing protein [Massilia sp. Leaf139]|uniref:twin-arginine translocation signal domain-containing protein n=1 Tax=Massilia sp. Leaf139 TaxID=1736272 RepID=UPI000ABD787C|nr:twin-arginine translocation signal domain-containing protein [Massilia sp. Leaf139]